MLCDDRCVCCMIIIFNHDWKNKWWSMKNTVMKEWWSRTFSVQAFQQLFLSPPLWERVRERNEHSFKRQREEQSRSLTQKLTLGWISLRGDFGIGIDIWYLWFQHLCWLLFKSSQPFPLSTHSKEISWFDAFRFDMTRHLKTSIKSFCQSCLPACLGAVLSSK